MSESSQPASELHTWTKAPPLIPGAWSFGWAFVYALVSFLLTECRATIQLQRSTAQSWGAGPNLHSLTVGVSSLIIGVSASCAYWQIKRITSMMNADRVTVRAIVFYCLIVLGIVFTVMNLFLDDGPFVHAWR
jgi:hypothetical protein